MCVNRFSQKCFEVQKKLPSQEDPEVYNLLVETYSIPPQVFLLRWVRLLFCREFKVEDTVELWSNLFQDACVNGETENFSLADYFALAMIRYYIGFGCEFAIRQVAGCP